MSTADRDRLALELFQGALDLSPDERAAWLADRYEGDDDLRREVEGLLRAHERTGGILDGGLPLGDLRGALPENPGVLREEQIEPSLRAALADRYRIVEELGRGGMAIVFLAWELKHDRRVVIKALKPAIAYLYGADRFEREVQLAARLAHPHILGLIDSGSEDGVLYYVMPHVKGETLKDRLGRDGALDLPQTRTLLEDIANALAYAHAMGVVHRDLKPGNVLCAGSHAYLMDFGIAKTLYEDEGSDLTGVGHVLGTPKYMAPEQASADPDVDHRADLYAWGLLAFEMLTGEAWQTDRGAPGKGGVREGILAACPDAPPGLVDLIGRSLEPTPADRVQSADDILFYFQGGVGRRPRTGAPNRGRWIAAAMLAAVAIPAAWFLSRDRAPEVVDEGGPTRVAVAPFANETSDPALDALGNLAGDWIAQGIQRAGTLPVLPWPTVLEASHRAEEEGQTHDDMVAYLGREVGAGIVVTGSFYEIGNELSFSAVATDARTGQILTQPPSISAPRDESERAIRELRDRILGGLAALGDDRMTSTGLMNDPPTLEAYRAFDRGLRLHLQQDYGLATDAYAEAFRLDTTFLLALLGEATTRNNTGDYAGADSIIQVLEARRERLSPYDDNRLTLLGAMLDGDGERALRAARRGLEMGPASRSSYAVALIAVSLNRPLEAKEVLEAVDPDLGGMRGWAQYWTQLSHARHLLGDFEGDYEAATSMRERYPERRVASVLQARALAASGDTARLARLLDEVSSMSPNTYWSYGGALIVAGEELAVHGFRELAAPYWEQAAAWLDTQLERDPGRREHRYWLGTAYYDMGRFDDAREVFAGLVVDHPDRIDYRGLAALAIAQDGDAAAARAMLGSRPRYDPGDYLSYLARIEAVVGTEAQAISLFSEALEEGVDGFPWLHASAFRDLWALRDHPQFAQLLARGARPN